MSKSLEFNDNNFQTEVLESKTPVLVDFWAAWCGPCRAVGPTIDELAGEFKDAARVGKLNVDENPEASTRFSIQSIPAVLVFKNGQVIDRLVGVQPKEKYQQALKEAAA